MWSGSPMREDILGEQDQLNTNYWRLCATNFHIHIQLFCIRFIKKKHNQCPSHMPIDIQKFIFLLLTNIGLLKLNKTPTINIIS